MSKRERERNADNGARIGQQALKHIRSSIMDITHTHQVPKEMPGYHDLHDIWMGSSAYILEAHQ